MTVLIVDDHPSFRASARLMLESEGYEVVGEAQDGQEALRAAAELRPQVVLLDVQLPDIDGVEVATRLSEQDPRPDVVLTSSREACDLSPRLSGCGARGFVCKGELSGRVLADLLD